MKVLLTTLNAKYIHTNLAIRLLFQLNKHHKGLSWKEFTIKENQDDVAQYCSDYDIIAFSCYIWNISQTLELAKKIKALNNHITIILGGPEVSYDYEDIIVQSHIDYIIVGEGETSFQEFIESFPDVDNVQNLVYQKNGIIISNKTAPIFDLKKYENIMPYADDDQKDLYNKVLYIETSRGCPYKCGFCLASLDNKVRYLPNQHIKNTLLFMMEHGRVIKFLDRTFNIKKDFTLDIFQFILDNYRPQNIFQFEITADILHPDIIQYIHDKVPKGLFRFEIGIQTVNQRANLEVNRKQNFDKTKQIVKQLDYKVEMHLDLIVGMALDYWDDIKFSFDEVFKLFAPEMQLGFLKFLKGTPVRNTFKEHEFVFDPNPPYQIIESKYLSKEQLIQIVKLEHALEIYWNSGRAINTLKYITTHYSIFDFLLELGVYFGTKKDYHRYSLTDIFEIIYQFVSSNYPHDNFVKQLIAVDYYLHYKVKPKSMFLDEVEYSEKAAIIYQFKLNHHKYRFIILPLTFHFDEFLKNQIILSGNYHLIIQYNGTDKPCIINTTEWNLNKTIILPVSTD